MSEISWTEDFPGYLVYRRHLTMYIHYRLRHQAPDHLGFFLYLRLSMLFFYFYSSSKYQKNTTDPSSFYKTHARNSPDCTLSIMG